MSMLKVRLQALRHSPFIIHPGTKKKPNRCRSRTDRAINGKYTLRTLSPEIREMMIERVCLKVELQKLAIIHSDSVHSSIAIQMADKIRRIEKLDNQIKGKK